MGSSLLLRQEPIEAQERDLERKRFAMEERIKTMRKGFELEAKEAERVIQREKSGMVFFNRKGLALG